MTSLTPKAYVFGLTAAEIEQRLNSLDNFIQKDVIRQSLNSPAVDTIPSTQAVVDALDPIQNQLESLGNLAGNNSVSLDSEETTGVLPITKGGTGGNTVELARQNLGVLTQDEIQNLINETVAEIGSVDLSSPQVTNVLPMVKGGTGADTPSHARANLGVWSSAQSEVVKTNTKEALRRSYAEAGYNVVGTFEAGFTFVNAKDVGIHESTGKGYSGPAGTVAAGTDPTAGGFVDRSGELLRSTVSEVDSRSDQLKSIVTVKSAGDIAALNKPTISKILAADSAATYTVTSTTTGKENTPDTIKMADGRFANRSGWYPPTRVGIFSTGDFGHRCGSFTYKKFSHTAARLLTDLSRFKPELNPAFVPVVRYLDPKNGVQGAGGTSWATAEKRWAEVIAMNPDIVFIRGGLLNGPSRITSFTLNKSMAIIGVGEPVVVGPLQGGTWSKEAGYSNLYRLAINVANTNTSNIFDTSVTNQYGTPSVLTNVTTLAECDATPGTWYQDPNFSVVVHTHDSRQLTGTESSIICTLVSGSNPVVTYAGNHRLYTENIQFWGGFGNQDTGDGALAVNANGTYPRSYFYNYKCGFNGARGNIGNGLTLRDIAVCISEKSESLLNKRDGFNYHWGLDPNGGGNNGGVGGSSQSPHFVEIDCFASGNGLGSSLGNNQGTTSHNNCHGFRINSAYTNHLDGGNVVDVESSRVWMVALSLQRSSIVGMRLSTTGSTDLDDGEWWVDGCVIRGNSSTPGYGGGDLSLDGTKTKVHVRDVISDKRMYAGTEIISVDDILG